MYLSRLEIIGFKSFAQKVNLTFDSGISAIVGPNGCGKTNIVDAIRWVLGEQRYSALRSEKMEDVIFNGTKARKPLGMAEASLVIENTKGILPSEYSQVTVSRRVYRSGESEYLLNKVPCRLKDILDLFMDTGMGADAYSVIELKMVETILSDKADERRRLFEEAAGVTKYKHRRKAAYRKLESVQADLVRVTDIVVEVQKAVNSLERQARKAGQFNEIKTRLQSMEIDVMEREFAQLQSRKKPLEEKLTALTDVRERTDAELTQEDARLDELRRSMADIEKRLAEAQRDQSMHMDIHHRTEQKNLIAAERTRALHETIARCETEHADFLAEKNHLETLKDDLGRRITDLQNQSAQLLAELESGRAGLQELEFLLEHEKAGLQRLNDRTIELVHLIADLQTAEDRKRGRLENLQGRAAHAADENAAYGQEQLRVAEEIAALIAEDKRLRRLFTEAEMRYYDAEKRQKELKDRFEEHQRREVQIRGEIQRRQSHIDFLKGLMETREGFSEGVRFLASTEQWKSAPHFTVADAVSAEDRFRRAIESGLGEFAGLIIARTAEEAEGGISLLQQDQRGKATFVCLDRVPDIRTRARMPDLPGVHGWALDLAAYDVAYAPLFRYILDRTLVVDTLATARQVITRFSGLRCVTVDGEVVTGAGVLRGGSMRVDEGKSIGRQSQIEDAQREMGVFEGECAALLVSMKDLSEQHDAILLKSFGDAVKSIEKQMSGVEVRMAQLEFEKKRAGDIIAKNQEEMELISRETASLQEEIAVGAPALEQLKSEKAEVERNTGAASSKLESLEQEWNKRSQFVHDLGLKQVAIVGEVHNAENDRKRADARSVEVLLAIEKRMEDKRKAEAEVSLSDVGVEENTRMLEQQRGELEALEAARSSVELEANTVRDEIHRIELKIKDERRTHDDSLKAVHELELRIADLQAKADHIKARAQEEFEYAIELKEYPEDEFVNFAALRDEIHALREKMKSLGNINFAAFEEYNTEKERSEFLSSQRKDLLEAEKTLLATIEEINATAQRKFLETFGLIRTNFIETFKSLFDPGDECDLKLEDEVDPLEAKIEIIAKPRGKRPTSIDLLSGGEKTLTATALLFAIYLVKPSPFCILDEVDAPLDDANVDRFTRILRKFSDNTQFIVVTHNKRTMEAANALYGVTMEEEGVSKLVTVRFNRGAEVQSAAVVSG
jgi:chromosome segregation protein